MNMFYNIAKVLISRNFSADDFALDLVLFSNMEWLWHNATFWFTYKAAIT